MWNKAFKESGTAGFTVRGPPELSTLKDEKAKADGVDVFLEIWEAGTSEPPHSHPGKILVFFKKVLFVRIL